MVVAEITIIPVTSSGDMRPCIDAAIGEFERAGLHYEVGALGTTVEGPLNKVMEVAIAAHQAAMRLGTGRCITEIRIDERKGEDLTIDREVADYRITMAEGGASERAQHGLETVRTKAPGAGV